MCGKMVALVVVAAGMLSLCKMRELSVVAYILVIRAVMPCHEYGKIAQSPSKTRMYGDTAYLGHQIP
jgi:hypothetical protein